MAFFSHTRTHTRTWQMTEWYVWQLWEVSEMLHGYWLMAFSFTHTHTHGHDKWQNDISDNYEKFHRDVSRILAHGFLFHTHTHGHDWRQNDISDNCEKFQRCYSDTQTLAHGILLPATHTHTDMTDARIIYLTIVRSLRDITRILAHGIHFHTHTHTHRALINGTHNTIMKKVYQWCCSWCMHTTSPDGWNLASTFPYRKNCSMVPVTQCIFQSWELDLSIFLDFLEHRKS